MRQFIPILLLTILSLWSSTHTLAIPAIQYTRAPAWLLSRDADLNSDPDKGDIQSGSFYRLYDKQIHLGERTSYFHFLQQITNETGVQENAQFTIPFSADFQQLSIHEVTIIRNGARRTAIDKSRIRVVAFESEIGDKLYHNLYQAVIVLDDVQKGDMIELSYSLKGWNPVFMNKFSETFNFVTGTPIINQYYSIHLPETRNLNYQLYGGAPAPRIIRKNGLKIYDWSIENLSPYDFSRDLSPAWSVSYPFVSCTEYNNWSEVVDWGLGVVQHYQYALPGSLKKLTADWEQEADGSLERYADLARRFVQNEIRYLGMEVGAYTHRPHTPTETYNNRYGDCKDKSILLVALLRAKGIQAWSVLVHTELNKHVRDRLPSPEPFNHMIVKAIINGHSCWIDPTITMQGGQIPDHAAPIYGEGLVLEAENRSTEPIASLNEGYTEVTETFRIAGDNDQPSYVEVHSTYSGGKADAIRSVLDMGVQKMTKDFQQYYARLYGNVESINNVRIEDDNLKNILKLHESYLIRDVWKEEDHKSTLPVYAQPIIERLPNPGNARNDLPVQVGFPINIYLNIHLKMPRQWQISGKDADIRNSAYSFSFTSKIIDSTVVLRYHLRTFQDHIPASLVAQYKRDYKIIQDYSAYQFYFQPGSDSPVPATAGAGAGSSINWIAVFACLVALTGSTMLCMRLNRKQSRLTNMLQTPEPLAGWMVILGFVLFLRIIFYLISFFYNGGYFDVSLWNTMNQLGASAFQLYLLLEMMMQVWLCVFCVWIFIWFLQRRDIFPKMFISLVIIETVLVILNLIIFYSSDTLHTLVPAMRASLWKRLFQSFVFIAIWITPIIYSRKVADIFLRPYRSFGRSNYRYIPESTNQP